MKNVKKYVIVWTPATILILIFLFTIIGGIFLGIYLGTLGKVDKNGFCMDDFSCLNGSNMVCSYGKCSCPASSLWNATISVCEKNISMTSMEKIVKFMSSGNYNKSLINSYNGNLFNWSTDAQVFETTSTYIFVIDSLGNKIVILDKIGNYIKDADFTQPYSLIPIKLGYVYVTTYAYSVDISVFDLNLNFLKTVGFNPNFVYNQFVIRYNPYNGYLYNCDTNYGYVNVFDTNLNRIQTLSFSTRTLWSYNTLAIGFYQSILGNVLILGTANNTVLAVLESSLSLLSVTNSICSSGNMGDILADPSGYVLISCSADQIVGLWFTNGTYLNNTGMSVTTTGYPFGFSVDSKGRLIVATYAPSGVEIFTPPDY